jgi:tRNA(Ile)-lysidine synthase
MVHLESMDRLCQREGRERWLHLPKGVRAAVSGGIMVIGRAEALKPHELHYLVTCPGESRVTEADLLIRWGILEGVPQGWREQRTTVFMDLEQIEGDLTLRSPLPGDRLRPLGLGGTRKVHDILVDDRVPRRRRWRVPVLVDARGIIWVVGHRLDERVGLRPETHRILEAMVLPLKPS